MWHVGDEQRWKDQNIALCPWREGGEEILVLPQRALAGKVAMPEGWVEATVAAIRHRTLALLESENIQGIILQLFLWRMI